MRFYKKGDKKLLNAWAVYDWANSVYPLVISTAIFPIYFKSLTKGESVDFLWFKSIENDAFIGYISSFTFLILAVISPILSGIADHTGYKKLFMKFFCYLGAISCMLLYSFDLDNFDLGIIYYFFAVVGFWGSLVFYNSFLPDIANIEQQDITSAKGYSLGYLGSIILLVFCLFIIQYPDLLNLYDKTQAVKISFVLVGIWWLVFSQYSFYYLPDRKDYNIQKSNLYSIKTLLSGFDQIIDVIKQLKENKKLRLFLFSFFIFTIPTQTIILLASYFGADLNEIGWKDEETMQTGLILAIIVIQILAAAGAYLCAKISSIYGNINTLIGINILWAIICFCGYFVTTPFGFYIAAGFIGLGMGGIQSLSRSTYSKLIDVNYSTSYFSFYDVSQKLSIVLGTALYATMDIFTGSIRLAILIFAIFFIPSIMILNQISKK
jgi:UMF1 family MFS transporter